MPDLDLARRAVASPRWRWMPGMRIAAPVELLGLRVADGSIVSPAALPDLGDAGTVGCLLALVREAWGDPYLFADVCWYDGSRHVQRRGRQGDNRGSGPVGWVPKWTLIASAPTEAAALVAALERAP